MENKIVLGLISKNLEEIKFLFETMLNEEMPDPLLIEITTLKAKTLYQELLLLLPKDSIVETIDSVLETEEKLTTFLTDEIEPNQESHDDEFSYRETTLIEEVVTVEEKIVQMETISLLTHEEEENEEVLDGLEEPVIDEEPVTEKDETVIEEPANEPNFETENDVDTAEETVEEHIPIEEDKTEETKEETPPEEIKDTVDEEQESVELIEIISETVIETTTITETVKESTEKKIFGEQFIKEPSLNDKLGSSHVSESRIKALPITSIKGAIGLNDRFLFTRELFGNDSTRYESAIDNLDQMANLLEAIEYLEKNFQWTKNNTSLKFMDLVKRRFEK